MAAVQREKEDPNKTRCAVWRKTKEESSEIEEMVPLCLLQGLC